MQTPSHPNPVHSLFPCPGRNPELREDLIESFQQLALEMGIPADSIFILANRGNPPRGTSSVACPPRMPEHWGCSFLVRKAGEKGGQSGWREERQGL